MLPESYYTPFLSEIAKSRHPSAIRKLLPLENTPGMISLLAGKPNPDTFPITGLTVNIRSPIDGSEEAISLSPAEIAEGLQYGPTIGTPNFVGWLRELQKRYHGRDASKEGWSLSVGSGSQDLLNKACSALIDPGDVVLVEIPVYAGIVSLLKGRNCETVEIETDDKGIASSSLRSILESWPKDKKRPKLLYTVPYGCNPTGMTATLERRKEVLELARKHDFLIFEDDPYFFLYYGDHTRYPSYFSLEKDGPESQIGRVIRFDSFSKVISAGIRIGFLSAPTVIADAINADTSTTNLQTSSITQMITWKFLESWGYELFQAHVEGVANFYREKRDIFEKALREIMSASDRTLVSWSTPEAGMFFWLRIYLPPHLEDDSEALIRDQAFQNGVLLLPGTSFLPNDGKSSYVRASFSLNSEEEVREALRRLKKVIEEVWRKEP